MHELSIVMSIIDIAEKEINNAGGGMVEEIELDIGQLSTIEMEAFDFAWQQGIKGSFLEEAKLIVNRIDGKAKCLEPFSVFLVFRELKAVMRIEARWVLGTDCLVEHCGHRQAVLAR